MKMRLVLVGAVLLPIVFSLATVPAATASPGDYDSDGDQIIDRDEVLDGIRDFFANSVGRDAVLELIRHYFSGARVDSGNAVPASGISNLSFTHGTSNAEVTLSPSFDTAVTSYSGSVGSQVNQVTVSAVADAGVTVTFVGEGGLSPQVDADAGLPGHQVNLQPGSNAITVRAVSGSDVRIYTVSLTRAANGDATLSALQLSGTTLSPAFDPATSGYSANVASTVTSTSVTALPSSAGSAVSIAINGTVTSDGTVQLVEGSNIIAVTVTAQDGVTTRTYTVSAVRAAAVDLSLSLGPISVIGYWSDGTADVTGTVTISTLGGVAATSSEPIAATCVVPAGTTSGSCSWTDTVLSNGLSQDSASFRLRVPMGSSQLSFAYGGAGSTARSTTEDIYVAERIVGVSRDEWNCYVNRDLDYSQSDGLGYSNFYGCSGWASPTNVVKPVGDGTVVIWGTGPDSYVSILREVVGELSEILNLSVQWTTQESGATLKAYVGIPRNQRDSYSLTNLQQGLVDAAGFAGSTYNARGATIERVVVWDQQDPLGETTWAFARHVIFHELLHALADIDHVSTRNASIMGYSSQLPKLSPMDEALFRLNANPLVRPGMTLDEVRELVVFDDQLLDTSPPPISALEMVWRAAIGLAESGGVRYRLSGGWTGNCSYPIGSVNLPVTIDLGGFEDFLITGPSIVRYKEANYTYWMVWQPGLGDWQYWLENNGAVTRITSYDFRGTSNWYDWPNKLGRALYTLIADWDESDVTVTPQQGLITLQVTLDNTYQSMWKWSNGGSLNLTLNLDANSHEISSYVWRFNWSTATGCNTYEEAWREGQYRGGSDSAFRHRNECTLNRPFHCTIHCAHVAPISGCRKWSTKFKLVDDHDPALHAQPSRTEVGHSVDSTCKSEVNP